MEANIKSVDEIKLAIIDHFCYQPSKFQESLIKEFKKEAQNKKEPIKTMSRYGNAKIHILYNEILAKDNQLFTGVISPKALIILTLSEYILWND